MRRSSGSGRRREGHVSILRNRVFQWVGVLPSFIDDTGAWVITLQFMYVWDFDANVLAEVSKGIGKWGFIDAKGACIAQSQLWVLEEFATNGLALAQIEDGKRLFIDRNCIPRLEIGFDQGAEPAGRWELGETEAVLYDDEGNLIYRLSSL